MFICHENYFKMWKSQCSIGLILFYFKSEDPFLFTKTHRRCSVKGLKTRKKSSTELKKACVWNSLELPITSVILLMWLGCAREMPFSSMWEALSFRSLLCDSPRGLASPCLFPLSLYASVQSYVTIIVVWAWFRINSVLVLLFSDFVYRKPRGFSF